MKNSRFVAIVCSAVMVFSACQLQAQMNADQLFIGSNAAGQTAPTFLASTACMIGVPTDVAGLGFPGMHMVLLVNGNAMTLSQNSDESTITAGNSVSCNAGNIHAGNSYYRSFNLATQGVAGDFTIDSVDVGIESSAENIDGSGPDFDGMQPIGVRFYWTTAVGSIAHDGILGPTGFDAGFDVLIAADGSIDGTVLNVPVSGVVVPDSATDLVVEIFTFGSDTTLLPDIGGGGCAFELGDVNNDGAINLLDVQPFVNALPPGDFVCEADINEDGAVTLLDVAGFVAIISGG